MKLGLGLSLANRGGAGGISSPIPSAGLSLWLKADAGVTLSGSNVTEWADQSGNNKNALPEAYNASINVGDSNPTFASSVVNGKPALYFDGTKYLKTANIFNGSNPRSMFVVYYVNDILSINVVCGIANESIPGAGTYFVIQARSDQDSNPYFSSNTYDLTGPTFEYNVWRLASADYDGTTTNLYSNGSLANSGEMSLDTANSSFYIGCDYYQPDPPTRSYCGGYICEVIAYNRVLTTPERQKVEAYLSNKYAIPNINNMFLPQLWLKADAGVSKFSYNYNYASQIVISGTSNPSFAGTYTADGVPSYNYDEGQINGYTLNGPTGKTISWDPDNQYLLSSNNEAGSFSSGDGENWTPNAVVAQIVITGFTGIYSGANGTYNGDGSYFDRVGGGFYIDGFDLYSNDEGVIIASAPANYSGAWTLSNYASRVTLSGATNATSINGNYDATEAITANSWSNSNGSYIYFDGEFIATNEEFPDAYYSGNLEDWVGSPEPAPSGAVTYTPRSAGSPTSTSSSKPTGSVSGVVTLSVSTVELVTEWADQSGNGRNASAHNNPQLITNQINGKPVIDFNASQYFTSNNQNLNNNSSIFFVAKSRGDRGNMLSTSNYEGLVFTLTANPNNSFSVGITNLFEIANEGADNGNNWMIGSTIRSNNLTSIIYKNGTQVANGNYDTSSLNPTAPLIIGADADLNSYWNLDGQIAEIIIYNRALTTPERQQVEAYLGNKYSIDLTGTIFNNTFNSTVDAQNTTWALGPFQEIATAPTGCPNPNCLHLLQGGAGTASLYSNQSFGQLGMLNLTQSYTIECWFYVTDINGSFPLTRGDGGDPIGIWFSGDRSITVFTNPDSISTNSSIFNLNSWNNFAVTVSQESSKTTIYINGVNCGEMGYTTHTNGSPARWEWGVAHDLNNGYDIYISNMRWTQKVLYTSNFTPSFTNFPNAQL